MEYIKFGNENAKVLFDIQKGFLEAIEYRDQFIPLHSKLWSIQTTNGEASIFDMDSFYYELYKDTLKLYWKSSSATVVITVCNGDDGKLRWNIRTEVYDNAINRVKFPIIEGLNFKNDNYLLIPWQNGHLLKNPIEKFFSKGKEVPFWVGKGKSSYEAEYPASLSFQFSTFYSSEDFGYYFATEDSDAYIKTFTFQYNEKLNALDYTVTNYPENMGKTEGYCMPYDFVMKLFDGDWQTAANTYRNWAINQKWCTQKLSERPLPEKLVKTDLWRINHMNYLLGTRTDEYLETSKVLCDVLNCNLALHWYGWNMGKHDLNYPEYISSERRAENWPEKLRVWNSRFDKEGIVKIPYINARLWEKKTKSWDNENAQRYAIKTESGELPEEPWNGYTLKPMCPATAMWQNKVVDLCREYVLEEGFDGVYLDQIASFDATLCFDKTHPHPLGGGTWWNDTYHNMLREVRGILGKNRILTTESCCETYIDAFDLFLILDTCFQHTAFNSMTNGGDTVSVPLFSLIYGDYALSYGSMCRFIDKPEHFEYKFIRNLLWGVLPCVEGAEMSELKMADADEKLAIIKRGVDVYKANKDVFLFGRLYEIPEYECDDMEIEWQLENGNSYIETIPSVMVTLWEEADGSKVLFAYNFSGKDCNVQFGENSFNVKAKEFMILK